jgi:hypothetical protein
MFLFFHSVSPFLLLFLAFRWETVFGVRGTFFLRSSARVLHKCSDECMDAYESFNSSSEGVDIYPYLPLPR